MKAAYSKPPGKAWKLGSGPYIFAGTPQMCQGELEIVNHSNEKIKVRELPVHLKQDKIKQDKKTKSSKQAINVQSVFVGIKIPADSKIRSNATLSLDPKTPPGTYETIIECADQKETAIVHVFENPSLSMRPSRIHVHGQSGETFEQNVFVKNKGNISFTVPDIGLVWFEEEHWIGRTMVYALRETQKDTGHKAFLDNVLNDFVNNNVPPTKVAIECDTQTIHPGDFIQLTLKFSLPKQLKKGRKYVGFIKLFRKRFWIEAHCQES